MLYFTNILPRLAFSDVLCQGNFRVLFSSSRIGMYSDIPSVPIFSTKLYSPVSLFNSMNFLTGALLVTR